MRDGSSTTSRLNPTSSLPQAVALGSADTLKLVFTVTENGAPKRPHQAFLSLQDTSTGAEDAYLISIKETGKGKIELVRPVTITILAPPRIDTTQTHKDLPIQFLQSSSPLKAHIILASFGSSTPFDHYAFDLAVALDQATPLQLPQILARYGRLEEIHHIFRADPKSPPKFISLIFVAAATATLPILIGIWATLGANLNHLPEAFGNAPLSHAAFLGSIIALEGIFFLYYSHWRLYQMLPAAGAMGLVAFLSGSRALSEVQGRRLVGKR